MWCIVSCCGLHNSWGVWVILIIKAKATIGMCNVSIVDVAVVIMDIAIFGFSTSYCRHSDSWEV